MKKKDESSGFFWLGLFLIFCLIACDLMGCAKTMAHREYFDAVTGNKIAVEDLTMSRPIFASMGAGSTSPSGTITMNSAASISVEQLMSMALQGYAQYTSYGLASKALDAPAIAVPKAGPQVTPPPADGPVK